ncbi:hypothetical protein BPADB04_48530 [Bacillus paranthracis]|uniref:hypothetical protein n=1 Tax=Bacillus paranthracis TaxID=2026186 RepID=UPI001C800F23|nr:hypothetical protein [Bacillus paranthracis]GIX59823.1 hypothetical protein BPADB04_48530 [Bacillus paranthracis]
MKNTTTVLNEMKTMEDVLTVLEKASYGTCPFEELPHAKQGEVAHKLQLQSEIENGNITDVEKAKRWLELIELVYTWALDDEFEYAMEHVLIFDEGTIQIFSTYGKYQDQFDVDFVDGKLYLDGETLESINFLGNEGLNSIDVLMNMIEFNITINA